jgi:putative peptide zinc metalloprotease protein
VLARLAWLFQARVAVAVAMAFVLVDTLVVCSAASATASANTLGWMQLALALALTAAGVFVHELGHLAACVRHGASHGGVGVGLYWCFPTFYSEVHGAWLLGRWQRAAVDAGGVYLQGGFVLLLGLAFLATRSPAVLGAIAWSHLLMLHTLNPVLKFDGYWLLTDLTGTPNLHRSITRTARRVLRAINPVVHGELPAARDLALFGVFTAVAIAYFAYMLHVLGDGIASALARVVSAFAAAEFTVVSALALAGRVVVVALLLAMALGISALVARSINSVSEESNHAD